MMLSRRDELTRERIALAHLSSRLAHQLPSEEIVQQEAAVHARLLEIQAELEGEPMPAISGGRRSLDAPTLSGAQAVVRLLGRRV